MANIFSKIVNFFFYPFTYKKNICSNTGVEVDMSPNIPLSHINQKPRQVRVDLSPPSYTKKRPKNITFCPTTENLSDLDSPFISTKDVRSNTIQEDDENTPHGVCALQNTKIKKS